MLPLPFYLRQCLSVWFRCRRDVKQGGSEGRQVNAVARHSRPVACACFASPADDENVVFSV
eukprot:SAG22_NODE_9184_length_604_cov_1.283168_1_plen_60_part_10